MAAPMPMYEIRLIANACITRYDGGERTIENIMNSYPALNDDDKSQVKAEIINKRPNIEFTMQGSA